MKNDPESHSSVDQSRKRQMIVEDCYDPKSEDDGDDNEQHQDDSKKNENDKKRKRYSTDNERKSHRSPTRSPNDSTTQSNREDEEIIGLNATSIPQGEYNQKPPSSVSYVPTDHATANEFHVPKKLASLRQQQRPCYGANSQHAPTTTVISTQTAAQPQSMTVPFGQQQSMIVTQNNTVRHGGFAPMTNASRSLRQSGDLYYVTAAPAQNTSHTTTVHQMNRMNQVVYNNNALTSELAPYSVVQKSETGLPYKMLQKGEIGPYAMARNSEQKQQNPLVVETKIQRRPGELEKYRDFSKLPCNENEDVNDSPNQINGNKEQAFPVKLHRILSNEDYSDYIAWLPHGRSWRVLRPKAFEEKIIPNYFRHAKYASFMRQVRLNICLSFIEKNMLTQILFIS